MDKYVKSEGALTLTFPNPDERLEFTGERYVPGISGAIQHEHYHRYLFAAPFCSGRTVFDMACGEGYGCRLLSQVAEAVVGGDLDIETVLHAERQYAGANLRFCVCDATAIPLEAASVDVVTSFETIEHFVHHEKFLEDVARVLKPDGLLIISSPNRTVYSEQSGHVNPFHSRELDREQFRSALLAHFRNVALFEQRPIYGSAIMRERGVNHEVEGYQSADGRSFERGDGVPSAVYFVAVASRADLPELKNSLLSNEHFMAGLQHEAWGQRERADAAEARVRERDAEVIDLRKTLNKLAFTLSQQEAGRGDANERREEELREMRQNVSALINCLAQHDIQLAEARKERSLLHAQIAKSYELLERATVQGASPSRNLLLQTLQARLGEFDAEKWARRGTRYAALWRHPFNSRKRKAYRLEHFRVTGAPFARPSDRELGDIVIRLTALARHPLNSRKRKKYRQSNRATGESEDSRSAAAPQGSGQAVETAPVEQEQSAQADTSLYKHFVENALGRRDPSVYRELTFASPPRTRGDVNVIAYYLPQFHPIPENDRWWGPGFTEWRNVARAHPVFEGHYQPRVPGELGYYDLRVTDTMRRQVELARNHAISAFCFHFYWFNGQRLLELPLENFLANPDLDLGFTLCWANENWSRRWDGGNNELLMAQDHSPDDDIAFIRYVDRYFRDPRYLKVDGKPVLTVYRPALLPDPAATTARWRAEALRMGYPGLYLIATNSFAFENYAQAGFDALSEFPPHNSRAARIESSLEIAPAWSGGAIYSYESYVREEIEKPARASVVHPGVMPGWDNSARRPHDGHMYHGATPEVFRRWLNRALERARGNPGRERFVFVNAWNEWAEGAYLEPDAKFGYAWLEAVRLAQQDAALLSHVHGARRVALVSHDAHQYGAQLLLLAIARTLRELRVETDLIVLDEGALLDRFAEVGTVHQLDIGKVPEWEVVRKLKALRLGGAELAIANTAVSGGIVPLLKTAGFRVVSLIHELPGILNSYKLQDSARAIAANADHVVFPADVVRTSFETFVNREVHQSVIRPQGLYCGMPHELKEHRSDVRQRVRADLNFAADSRMILCVGCTDFRKGVDLFVDACLKVMETNARAVAVWVGKADGELWAEQTQKINAAGLSRRFAFVGLVDQPQKYYVAADVFALTSREDPFPSVVLEALDAELPVVAFKGAGGFAELLQRGCGILVPAFDCNALARTISHVLDEPTPAKQLARTGRAIVENEFNFRRYVQDLLALNGAPFLRVSAIVPNMNYARYLKERLKSIAGQSVAPYELIVLDDASTDESTKVIREFLADCPIPSTFLQSAVNSGSVMRQWQRGVQMARGDIIWIAEADDLAEADFLAEVLPAFANPDVVLSYCQSRQIDGAGQRIADDYLAYVADIDDRRWRRPYVATGCDEIAEALFIRNTIPNVSAVLFRREALSSVLTEFSSEVQAFRHAGDWATYLRVLEKGSIAFCPNALNAHRRHSGSVTLGRNDLRLLQEIVCLQRMTIERYALSAGEASRADAYAQRLYEQFGLTSMTHPRFEDHPGLKGALKGRAAEFRMNDGVALMGLAGQGVAGRSQGRSD